MGGSVDESVCLTMRDLVLVVMLREVWGGQTCGGC
jgi:hypothetical protein